MKEPAVVISMIVQPAATNSLRDTNIAGGVIVADQGPIVPTYYNDPQSFLNAFTPTGVITRDTHSTVVHAYALSKVIPILVCRAYQGSKSTKSGKAIISSGAVQSQKVFKKQDLILVEVTPMQFTEDLEAGQFNLQVGTVVYRDGPLKEILPVGLTDQLIEVAEVGTPLESFIFAINEVNQLFQLELVNEEPASGGGSYFANIQVYGLKNTTVPLEKYPSTDYTYNWLSVASINESVVVMYLFANAPSTTDFTGYISAASSETDLLTLNVTTPSKDYSYEGSLNKDFINAYGKNQFIENINIYPGIEFEVVVGPVTTNNFVLTAPIPFGSMAKATKSLKSTNYTDALHQLLDDDRYRTTYLCALGYNNQAYVNDLVIQGEARYSFVPCGLFVTKNDPAVIKANMLNNLSSQFLLMAPHEVNTSLANFAINLSLEVAYISRIQSNKSRGSEFAPFMGETNSSISIDSLSVNLSKTTRESLLDSNIMSVITKATSKYLNKNKSTSSVDDVISQEQNQRLANKINRDVDQLMVQFLGQYNNESTRSRALSVLNTYFATEVMNQNFTLDRVTLQCDEVNNSPATITNGQLVVDIKGVYQNTIYEVKIYHRVYDLLNAA